METSLKTKLSFVLLCVCFTQVGCNEDQNIADPPPMPSNSGASSSSSSSSSSASSSTSSGFAGRYTRITPLDAFEGLLPRSFGGGNNNEWGEAGYPGNYSVIYAAINAGSDMGVPTDQLHRDFDPQGTSEGFIADQYFVGGKAVDRNDLADQQEAILHEPSSSGHRYKGTIFPPSRSARTGEFTYEIEVPEKSVALEIHVVPLQLEPYTDVPFSITIENMPVIESLFTPSTKLPLSLIQGFTFEDVEIEDGYLTLTFDLPEGYFGVSAIFISDYAPWN